MAEYEWAVLADEHEPEDSFYDADDEADARVVAALWSKSGRFTNVTVMRRSAAEWVPAEEWLHD